MSVHSLIILPNDPLAQPPLAETLHKHMARIGLVGESYEFFGQKAFKTGKEFENHILFVDARQKDIPARQQGILVPEREPGLQECHIEIHDYSPRIEALLGSRC